jgi:hypothetical protein
MSASVTSPPSISVNEHFRLLQEIIASEGVPS